MTVYTKLSIDTAQNGTEKLASLYESGP